MDDLYPGMNVIHTAPFSSLAELYIYGSAILGIIGIFTIVCSREPQRIYRSMRRKNTDESPIIQI